MTEATAAGSATACAAASLCEGSPLPLGRRVPAGRLRWYLLRVPEGREQAACERLERLAPAGLVDEAFFPLRERYVKKAGAWSVRALPMWRGYAVVATREASSLKKALAGVGAQAEPVGATDAGWAPLAPAMQGWLSSVVDGRRVVRASVGRIVGGELRVDAGPLKGQEGRVVRIDRHRRTAWVRVCGVDVPMPLEVTAKEGAPAGASSVSSDCRAAARSGRTRTAGAA